MALIYLAGPINGKTDDECRSWRVQAASILRAQGHEVLDPLTRDYRGRELENVSDLVTADLVDIRKSDAILANCQHPSWGTAMELRSAYIIGVPVFGWTSAPSKCSPWLHYHLKYLTDSMQSAADALAASFFGA